MKKKQSVKVLLSEDPQKKNKDTEENQKNNGENKNTDENKGIVSELGPGYGMTIVNRRERDDRLLKGGQIVRPTSLCKGVGVKGTVKARTVKVGTKFSGKQW